MRSNERYTTPILACLLFSFDGILPFFLCSYKKCLVQIYNFIALCLEVTKKGQNAQWFYKELD